MAANTFTKEVPVPELGAGMKLKIGANAFAAIEAQYAREDQISGTTEYWWRCASLLENASPEAIHFVVSVGLRGNDGAPVKDFDLDQAFDANDELTLDKLSEHCLNALSLGRFGKKYIDLLNEIAELQAKKEEPKKDENPPKSPDTGSTD